MLFVILLALRASSHCKHDMGVLSWLNVETLETACTRHFDGLVRCSLSQHYGTTVGLTVVYTNHMIMVIYFVHTKVYYSIATLNPQLKKQVSVDNTSDVQVWHQRLSNLIMIFLCSLIQTLTLTPPPNNALLANMDV